MNVRKIKSGPKKQSGLTLLETIVAILVLGFAMAGLAAVVPLFQSLDDVDDIDRFARKAQGCAEVILACHRAVGEDAFDGSNVEGLDECGGLDDDDEDITVDDLLDTGTGNDCDIDVDLDAYCGNNDLGIEVYCNVVGDDYTEFMITSDVDGASPVYFGLPVTD
ncbi:MULTISPECIES: prepilin-type N-terminal cleavage/methylation domain-containing protein [Halorhodospira]|uniref:type IV pilus modification PilV family protein n=1 Tax=Halorhodospira TaxID=85108 RepID=UPI001EE793BB|nr:MULTISPECIES: type II secretion system protein [Halorhodospira]MCG5528639.1 type II secretion system GspH family protein [Halorhodospira halophila]MCG5543966.1 type II secretion system GspH family protein [Halorhodospira sp. 9628]